MQNVYEQIERFIVADPEEAPFEGEPVNMYVRAATLGFVTGIRSMTPLALLNWMGNGRQGSTASPQLLLTTLAALGEAAADKLPIIPSRTSSGPLLGRMAIGGLGGMLLCRRAHLSPVVGVVVGAAGAGIGSYVSTASRTWLSKTTKIPSPLWGVLEDALALGLGFIAVPKKR